MVSVPWLYQKNWHMILSWQKPNWLGCLSIFMAEKLWSQGIQWDDLLRRQRSVALTRLGPVGDRLITAVTSEETISTMKLTCHWHAIGRSLAKQKEVWLRRIVIIFLGVLKEVAQSIVLPQLAPFFWIIGNSAMSFSADAPFPSIDLRLQEDPPPRRLNVGQMYLGSGLKLLAHFLYEGFLSHVSTPNHA